MYDTGVMSPVYHAGSSHTAYHTGSTGVVYHTGSQYLQGSVPADPVLARGIRCQ